MHSFKTKKIFLKSIFRNNCHYCPFHEPHSVQYWWDHSFSLGFCSITAICGTPRKRLRTASCPCSVSRFKVGTMPRQTHSMHEHTINFLPPGSFQGTWPKYQLQSNRLKGSDLLRAVIYKFVCECAALSSDNNSKMLYNKYWQSFERGFEWY